MYDDYFAGSTLNSKKFHTRAKREASFLARHLNLKQGEKLLDVPCGTGRHCAEFAKKGLKVTGIDISPDCLKRAKRHCRGLQVTLKPGDMSKLAKYRGKFDVVTNIFTSFGYFSNDRKNEQVLRGFVAALRPGGRLAIQLVDRDWLMTVYEPVRWEQKNDQLTVEARTYDSATKYNEALLITLNLRTNFQKSYYHRIRLYSKTEIMVLLRKCGLKNIRVFGDYKGKPYQRFKSTHPIYLGEKPGPATNP